MSRRRSSGHRRAVRKSTIAPGSEIVLASAAFGGEASLLEGHHLSGERVPSLIHKTGRGIRSVIGPAMTQPAPSSVPVADLGDASAGPARPSASEMRKRRTDQGRLGWRLSKSVYSGK